MIAQIVSLSQLFIGAVKLLKGYPETPNKGIIELESKNGTCKFTDSGEGRHRACWLALCPQLVFLVFFLKNGLSLFSPFSISSSFCSCCLSVCVSSFPIFPVLSVLAFRLSVFLPFLYFQFFLVLLSVCLCFFLSYISSSFCSCFLSVCVSSFPIFPVLSCLAFRLSVFLSFLLSFLESVCKARCPL